jgi:hypothetical protein
MVSKHPTLSNEELFKQAEYVLEVRRDGRVSKAKPGLGMNSDIIVLQSRALLVGTWYECGYRGWFRENDQSKVWLPLTPPAAVIFGQALFQ